MDIVVEHHDGTVDLLRNQEFKALYILDDKPMKTLLAHVLEEDLREITSKCDIPVHQYGFIYRDLEEYMNELNMKSEECNE